MAPELGLEPRTSQLTEGRTGQEFARLAGFTATLRPLLREIVDRLLDATRPGVVPARSVLIELAAKVERVVEGMQFVGAQSIEPPTTTPVFSGQVGMRSPAH